MSPLVYLTQQQLLPVGRTAQILSELRRLPTGEHNTAPRQPSHADIENTFAATEEDSGFKQSPSAHMWRTINWPTRYLQEFVGAKSDKLLGVPPPMAAMPPPLRARSARRTSPASGRARSDSPATPPRCPKRSRPSPPAPKAAHHARPRDAGIFR